MSKFKTINYEIIINGLINNNDLSDIANALSFLMEQLKKYYQKSHAVY